MSNALTLDSDALESEIGKKITALKRIGRVIIFALISILFAGALIFLAPFITAPVPLGNVDHAARWTLFGASIAALLGMIVLLRMLSRLRVWHREFQKKLVSRLKDGEKLSAAASISFRNQIAEARQAEERLQKQNVDLGEKNTALQVELDRRKAAEKNLHQERRELARSKDVLEIHVQERTQEIQKLQHRYELILNSAGDGICGL